MTTPPRPLPHQVEEALKKWKRNGNLLRFLQVILGIAGVAFSITAASSLDGGFYTKPLIALATFCFTILQAFDISRKADSFREAHRHLNTAVLRFQNVDGYTIDNLVDSHSQAQQMLGSLTFRQPPFIK